jgi:putative acetyltransferase
MERAMTTPAETALPISLPAGLSIRARETADWREIYHLTQLPRVRWGTLRLPFASPEETRKWMENASEGHTSIVAVLDGRIVGNAGVTQYKFRRSHVGGIAMCVHDDFHGRGIGSALLGTLVDAADNWFNLKRLELSVFVDNEPAIRLYKKFGFEIEGTRRAEAFREGRYVDAFAMARLCGL